MPKEFTSINDGSDRGKCVPFDPWRSDRKIKQLSDILAVRSEIRLQLKGQILSPLVGIGSVITLCKVPADQLAAGDLILARCEGDSLKICRFLAFKQKKGFLFDQTIFVVESDGLLSSNQQVREADYISKVIRIEHNTREISSPSRPDKPLVRMFDSMRIIYSQIKSLFIRNCIDDKAKNAGKQKDGLDNRKADQSSKRDLISGEQ